MIGREALIRFEDAAVGYDGRAVVEHATFTVSAGEFVGLVGPNAAGKSTLLRSLTGSARLFSGKVELAESPLERLTPRERALLVGVVPQTPAATFAFTARTFVQMGRNPHLGAMQAVSAQDDEVVADVMRLTDTAHLGAETIDTLSGGDLQRLTVAQALAQQPRVLLLDEATAHLDLNHALQVLDLVRRLADEGLAVLAVFHDLDLAARYSDRIAVVASGTVRSPQVPEKALDAAVISDVFDVRAVVRMDPVSGAVSVVPIVRGAELAQPHRGPVGVVCGSGSGARLLRRLAQSGVSVTCGALSEGDIDEAVARALDAGVVLLPPFGDIDPSAEERVRLSFVESRACIICDTPFGRANVANLRAAVRSGVPLLLIGDMTPERDYSGGEASGLWAEALAAGAERVSDEEAALDAVLRLLDQGSVDG